MPNFGIATSIAALDTDVFAQQEHTRSPSSSGTTVEDSGGEIACEERHSAVRSITESYKVYAAKDADTDGKVAIEDYIKGGQIKASDGKNYAVSELRLETSNQTKPVLTVTLEEYFGDTSQQPVYTPPFGRVYPRKRAQAIGIIVGASSTLARCTAALTLGGMDRTDHPSDGSFVSTDLFQGRATTEAELLSCSAAPAAVADTANGWELEQELDLEERAKEFGKATAKAFIAVEPD